MTLRRLHLALQIAALTIVREDVRRGALWQAGVRSGQDWALDVLEKERDDDQEGL